MYIYILTSHSATDNQALSEQSEVEVVLEICRPQETSGLELQGCFCRTCKGNVKVTLKTGAWTIYYSYI